MRREAGWWAIDSIERGQIETSGEDTGFYNGDGPADIMDRALDKIAYQYMESFGRWPHKGELLACLNFCSNAFVVDGQYIPPDAE